MRRRPGGCSGFARTSVSSERFTNFGAAWTAFLARRAPLESFYELLPEDEGATLDVWLLAPPEPVKAAAAELQTAFAHLRWLELVPPHFLHVTICHAAERDPARVALFEIVYRRVNCFAEAVVVEVEGEGLHGLADGPFFLPHLTLAYVREESDPEELRAALVPLREVELGTQRVEDVLLCRVPAARTTFLQPWTVLRRVRLRR